MTVETAPPVVSATGLGIDVGARHGSALTLADGVDLDVWPGERLAILGRSGSGKTTLLATLGLLRPPDRGRITVGGQSVTGMSDARLAVLRNKMIGFVFQDYSLIPHVSVLENVMLPMTYGTRMRRSIARARATAQLKAVGLSDLAHRRPASLSGGEQQRVAIARALVRAPRLLLADEPTGALDATTGENVLAHLLAATSDNGAAAVIVTHDEAVAATTDRVVELRAGILHDLAAT